MKMSLQNIVEFQFTANPTYGIQRLRMTPKESERQKILSWEIILKGAKKEIEYVDHHGNVCVLLTFEKDTKSVSVLAQGEYAPICSGKSILPRRLASDTS